MSVQSSTSQRRDGVNAKLRMVFFGANKAMAKKVIHRYQIIALGLSYEVVLSSSGRSGHVIVKGAVLP